MIYIDAIVFSLRLFPGAKAQIGMLVYYLFPQVMPTPEAKKASNSPWCMLTVLGVKVLVDLF